MPREVEAGGVGAGGRAGDGGAAGAGGEQVGLLELTAAAGGACCPGAVLPLEPAWVRRSRRCRRTAGGEGGGMGGSAGDAGRRRCRRWNGAAGEAGGGAVARLGPVMRRAVQLVLLRAIRGAADGAGWH